MICKESGNQSEPVTSRDDDADSYNNNHGGDATDSVMMIMVIMGMLMIITCPNLYTDVDCRPLERDDKPPQS